VLCHSVEWRLIDNMLMGEFMSRKGVITSLSRMRGRYLGDGFTKVIVDDVMDVINHRDDVCAVTVVNKKPDVYPVIAEGELKRGGLLYHPNGSLYVIEGVSRIEVWPSRSLIATFSYSHEADGYFYYRAKYGDGFRVIQGIRDPGERVAHVQVSLNDGSLPNRKTFRPLNMFVIVV
jgi:hypothetical protein